MTPARGETLRILLSGMVAGVPGQGGASWAVLQYVLGLRRLGHHVLLVEPVEHGAVAPAGTPLAESKSAAFLRGLPFVGDDGAALLVTGTREAVGLPYRRVERFARDADLLINISGMLRDDRLIEGIPIRAYLDLDPGFNQVWHETGEDVGLDGHTHYVTVGQAIGSPDCPVPTCGRDWIPTVPPVVLEHWPPAGRPALDAFTTVGHWRSYGPITYGGVHYGQRAHSLRELMALPRRTAARFQLALGIHPDERDDLDALEANGWGLLDPARVAGTPELYATFLRASKAELGVAKSGYVASRCGWLSDRSVCYLASARPVVAQETGFGELLPTGEGLLAFAGLDEAVAAVEAVESAWERHAAAARSLAEEHFESGKVLRRLLERLGSTPIGADR